MREDLGELLAGRYRILAPIGRGGMGAVWRVWDSELDRTVAIKELRLPEHVGAEERRVFFPDRPCRRRSWRIPHGRVRRNGLIKLWDVASARATIVLTGHDTDTVGGLGFSPDGRTLASTCTDKTVRLWSLP